VALRLTRSVGAQGHPERGLEGTRVEGWQVVARHDYMPASARHQSTASYGGPRRSAGPVWRREGGPFGEEVAPPIPPQEKRLFTGKERDSETGLDYFGTRYYRADVGRFTTVDPAMTLEENLVDPQRWNRYAYARNNPLKYVDPDGRDAIYVNFPRFPTTVPNTDVQLPLGHAAVIAIDEKTGATQYYDYGRYGGDFGKVERRWVPDLVLGKDGQPTAESLDKLRQYVSAKLGKETPADFTYYNDADSKRVVAFALQRMNDDKRDPYSWKPWAMNTFKTFAADAVEAGRPQAPWWKRWLGLKRDEEKKDQQ
jgi:RHS repeat-associated protein